MALIEPVVDILPHQYQFVYAEDKFVFLIGGFGSGKSTGIVLRAIQKIIERKGEGIVGVIAPTYTLCRDVNIPDFMEFLDQYQIRYKLNKNEYKIKIDDEIKGEIWFRSGNNPEKIIGFEWTDFIIDEFDILKYEQQKVVWNKAIARIRKCRDATGAIATTPEGFKFTYELVNDDKKRAQLIKAKTPDNIFLPPDYVEMLYNQYDELLVKQYINGEFVNIKGMQAYYAFERSKHVIPKDLIEPPLIRIGMDFNVDPMTACLSGYYNNKLVTFDEYYLRNSNTERMAEAIKEDYRGKESIVYPDMSGLSVGRSTKAALGVTDITILQKAGFRIGSKSNPSVRDRRNTVNAAFNQGKLFIMNNCKHLIRDLEQVVVDEKGEIDKSNLELTHSSDGYGYKVTKLFPIQHKRRKTA